MFRNSNRCFDISYKNTLFKSVENSMTIMCQCCTACAHFVTRKTCMKLVTFSSLYRTYSRFSFQITSQQHVKRLWYMMRSDLIETNINVCTLSFYSFQVDRKSVDLVHLGANQFEVKSSDWWRNLVSVFAFHLANLALVPYAWHAFSFRV